MRPGIKDERTAPGRGVVSEVVLVFDFDGTIVDSIDATRIASSEVLAEHGFDALSTESTIDGMRFETRDRFAYHSGLNDEQTLMRMSARYFEVMASRVDRITPVDGMVDAFIELTDAGYRLAIYSNNRGATIRRFLEAIGIADLFELVLGEGDSVALKPSGDGLAHIARTMDVPVAGIIYVGDGESDALAAERAGCFALGVTWVIDRYGFALSSRFTEAVTTTTDLTIFLHRWVAEKTTNPS